MKKLLSILLCLTLILGLAACGSKQETTEAPTQAPATTEAPRQTEAPAPSTEKPAETTPAPTLPISTTAAPSQPAETTPAPTEPPATEPEVTEPAPGPETGATAEEVFQAMTENLLEVVKAIYGMEAEPVQLSFSASGEGRLVMSYDVSGMSGELPLEVSGKAEGILDSEKGIHLNAEYSENLSSLMAMLLGGGEFETEPQQLELYRDNETGRSYRMTLSEGTWYYSELEPDEAFEPTTEGMTLEAVFKSYSFTEENGLYVFEGPLNTAALALSSTETLEDLPFEELVITLRLLADQEMRLCGLSLTAAETELNLDDAFMEGFTGKLEVLHAEAAVSYEAVEYALPDEVRDGAIEEIPDFPGESSHPWADNLFVTDNEVLADSELYSFRAVSVQDDEWLGLQLSFEAENKSDKKLTFDFQAISVNGYFVKDWLYESAEAHETIQFDTTLNEDDLNLIGVKSVDEIRLLIRVSDGEDFETLEDLVYYPTGLSAEEVVYPERRTNAKEALILENEDVTIIFLETSYDPFWGFTLISYIENRSDKNLEFSFEDVKINDIDFSTWWQQTVPGGFKGYFEDQFAIDSIEVERVEKLTASLELSDADDWWADPIYTGEIEFEP